MWTVNFSGDEMNQTTAGSLALLAMACSLGACATGTPFGTRQTSSNLPAHCQAPEGVDWEATLVPGYTERAEDGFAHFAESRGWPATSVMTGSDVTIRFYTSQGAAGSSTAFARLERRDGAWRLEKRVRYFGATADMTPYPPGTVRTAICRPAHSRLGGPISQADAGALNTWVDDPCRGAEPAFVPSILFMEDGSAQDCLDGTSYTMQVETADGITRYMHGCRARFSAGEIMQRIINMDVTDNQPLPHLEPLEVTWSNGLPEAAVCREAAQDAGIDIHDPWAW